ncbi:MAG: hypothetical protein U0L47_07360 [Paludibacteraceae bacterium]|nr:hypothetical protein [Paludibacteraceae bacterium]
MPDLKIYTILDLRNWLIHNHAIGGLSEKIIAPQRAYAIINNPYVKDEDSVLCAILENGIPVAYTAAFPDYLVREKRLIWWFSTLYCHPRVQGKGYGLIVVGQLCEMIGEGNYFDMDGAEETVSIFTYFGLITRYIPRYMFTHKNIHCTSLKGMIAYLIEIVARWQCLLKRKKLSSRIAKNDYILRYVSCIDDTTYRFIVNHASDDAFLRSQAMLNWILAYPFMLASPLINRVEKSLEFSSVVPSYVVQAVQVWNNEKLMGVFIYRMMDKEFSVKYLYYDHEYANDVFEAIAEHVISLKAQQIQTTDNNLAYWLRSLMLTTKIYEENQSFSYPNWFEVSNKSIQQGDGDVFV